MMNLAEYTQWFATLQWFAAVLVVPLACWQFKGNHSLMCRGIALLSGYGLQVGFFLLLDDAGFEVNRLLMLTSVAAYFWISTTFSLLPARKAGGCPLQSQTGATALAE